VKAGYYWAVPKRKPAILGSEPAEIVLALGHGGVLTIGSEELRTEAEFTFGPEVVEPE
jgi:hypothetical protein